MDPPKIRPDETDPDCGGYETRSNSNVLRTSGDCCSLTRARFVSAGLDNDTSHLFKGPIMPWTRKICVLWRYYRPYYMWSVPFQRLPKFMKTKNC